MFTQSSIRLDGHTLTIRREFDAFGPTSIETTLDGEPITREQAQVIVDNWKARGLVEG